MGEFSITHILLLGIIALIFFGPSRLPALGQSLGKAIKGFKQGLNEIDAEVKPVEEAQKLTNDRTKSADVHQTISQDQKEKQNS
jgi:TatA/E family protein of Tat protein translocase